MGEFEQFQELCIGCRRCTTVCPGKIDIPGLIEELRIRNVQEKGLPFVIQQAFDHVISNRKLFHSLLRLAAIGQKPFQAGRLIRHLPLFLAGMAKDRSLPAIADKPLRDRIGKITKKIDKPDKRVVFFSGCTIDFVFPETGESVFKVLQDLNMEVLFPEGQSCCGKPVIALGDVETTKKIARENIRALKEMNPDVIIAACPTCTESLQHYAELLKEDAEWGPKAEAMAKKVREFCSFVAEEYGKRGRLTKAGGRAEGDLPRLLPHEAGPDDRQGAAAAPRGRRLRARRDEGRRQVLRDVGALRGEVRRALHADPGAEDRRTSGIRARRSPPAPARAAWSRSRAASTSSSPACG